MSKRHDPYADVEPVRITPRPSLVWYSEQAAIVSLPVRVFQEKFICSESGNISHGLHVIMRRSPARWGKQRGKFGVLQTFRFVDWHTNSGDLPEPGERVLITLEVLS